MISTSAKYKQELITSNRNYVVKANITLADGTPLVLTNQELWDQGVVIDSAISSTNSFDIGAAIIGSLTLVIDNILGNYNAYDFANAKVVLWMGIENDLDENDDQIFYRIGFYVVDNTSYNGSLITLDCLDNMTWFDVPFSEVTGITYPTTAGQLVAAMCSHVGVLLGVAHFQNYTMTISEESGEWLSKNNINCREVLQYVAQKCCCYCKINTAGELILKWYNKDEINNIINYDGGTYDTTTTPYSDGDDVEGGQWYWDGSRYVWTETGQYNGGEFTDLQNAAWLTRNFEMNVSTEDIVITGCRVRSTSNQDPYDELYVDATLEQTHDRYVLVIENNPLIIASEAASVANIVGSILANLPLRAFDSRSVNDVSYETGDMVTIVDFRGNVYYTWITNLTFTIGNSENFSCGAQSIKKRNETRFSGSAKTLAEAKQNAEDILTDYDRAVKAMNELAQNAIGYREYYYPDEATALTSRVTYRFNGADNPSGANPKFPNSTVVFKISGDGVFISTSKDSQGYEVFTNGYDANSGTAILNLLYAQGLNAKWIKAGTIDTARLNVSGIVNGINNGTTTIDGGKITTNTIDTSQIKADAVTAAKINVDSLSAISANMGSITSGTITSGIINGNSKFNMKANGSSEDTEMNWGDTWGDSLTIVSNSNSEAGLGVCQKGYKFTRAVYIHYNDVRLYENDPNPQFAVFEWPQSDKRLKENIVDLDEVIVKRLFEKIHPVKFKYINGSDNQIGLIAQELIEILDELGLDKSQYVYKNGDGYYMLKYNRLVRLSMLATHYMYEKIDRQQEEIDLLKQEIAELKARIK